MTKCLGNGKCFKKCDCKCFDGEEDDPDDVEDRFCNCEHRDHNGYCPTNCCQLINCRNFLNCNKKVYFSYTIGKFFSSLTHPYDV